MIEARPSERPSAMVHRSASADRPSVGGGRVLMWEGGSLWVSRATGRAQPHAHHAIQVTLAPDHPVRLRNAGSMEWRQERASIVLPHCPHQFDGDGRDVAMVFIEPETAAGRRLMARYGHADLAGIADAAVLDIARELLRLVDDRADDAVLVAGAKRIVDRLAGEVTVAATVDPRIARALEWMRSRLDSPIALAQAASVVHLSPGRFRHLFVAQTGISFRAYLLWARVGTAMVAAMAGESWTKAAQDAGFADSAHFSRTCRRMFGIAPSMLERAG
jgi:AraC-like DNA-binding protein